MNPETIGVKTSEDLRQMIFDLLRINEEHPPLDAYLLSLLAVASENRAVKKPSYHDIGHYLMDAFKAEPAKFENPWLDVQETLSVPNSKEYFIEIYTYDYFERNLKKQIARIVKKHWRFTRNMAPITTFYTGSTNRYHQRYAKS